MTSYTQIAYASFLKHASTHDGCRSARFLLRDAAVLMSEDERRELVAYVATNPEAGVIMPSTGGVRKLRWAAKGRGKRGGIRVIYYYAGETWPVFLLNVFAKNQKTDLSQAEKNEMRRLVPRLTDAYKRRFPK